MNKDVPELDIWEPQRWGLPAEAVADVAERLRGVWTRFRPCFLTRTRDPSEYAWVYLRGVLTMDTKRNFANMARRLIDPADDGQNLQQFMADSPWAGRAVVRQVQAEIAATPELQTGSVLILDESATEKASGKTVGAGRQHNGRLGKIEMSQVGTFLALANGAAWTWVDGELFLPESWFSPELAPERRRVGISADRQFATKVALGWTMIQRAQANGLPFEALVCDDLYGRAGWFRRTLDEAGILYMADVPADTQVYLTPPAFGVPVPSPTRQGRPPCRAHVLDATPPVEVRHLAHRADTAFQRVRVRSTERGELTDPFAWRRVWTVRDGELAEEWLLIRHEDSQRYRYALSNAPPETPPARLAWLKCSRHFVERAHQDAKSEAGWDELQAQKYRAWEHHLALTILATWFVAQTKLDWARTAAQDPTLARQLEVDVLPALSMANVRQLLQAALPLPHLSPDQATRLVITHLVNRSRSTSSRLKAQHRNRGPT